jgi:hypothetical protein
MLPTAVYPMSTQHRLDVATGAGGCGAELGNGPSATHDGEVLTSVFDGVEDV